MTYFAKYRNRLDLSEWMIHFVHQRTGSETLSELATIAANEGFEMDSRYHDYYDEDGNKKYILDALLSRLEIIGPEKARI